MRDGKLTVDEIADALKVIENEQIEIHRVINKLSWRRVVLIPTSLSISALAFDAVLMLLPSIYDLVLLTISVALVLGGLFHLLSSLRLIEKTTVRPGLSVEG